MPLTDLICLAKLALWSLSHQPRLGVFSLRAHPKQTRSPQCALVHAQTSNGDLGHYERHDLSPIHSALRKLSRDILCPRLQCLDFGFCFLFPLRSHCRSHIAAIWSSRDMPRPHTHHSVFIAIFRIQRFFKGLALLMARVSLRIHIPCCKLNAIQV